MEIADYIDLQELFIAIPVESAYKNLTITVRGWEYVSLNEITDSIYFILF